MHWAQELDFDFLNSVLNSNIDDRQSIGSAVLMEFTLMIVASRRAQKRILPKKLYSIYDAKDNAIVSAAACFCRRTEAKVSMGFLTWMAASQTYPNMPLGVDSWQRITSSCRPLAQRTKNCYIRLSMNQPSWQAAEGSACASWRSVRIVVPGALVRNWRQLSNIMVSLALKPNKSSVTPAMFCTRRTSS